MRECWLKPNHRPTYAALAAAVAIVLLAGTSAVATWQMNRTGLAVGIGLIALLGLGFGAWIARSLGKPRVSYHDGTLYVHDGSQPPHEVPIEVVEVFFLGSGPIDENETDDAGPRAANVVIRLAEAETQWHEREMNSNVGKWSEGYIVLRGMWCEPIGHQRLNAVNHRLAEVRRARRNSNEAHQVNA